MLTAALELLEAPGGPVLTDYPEDAPAVEGPATLVCPVSFPLPATDESDVAKLSTKFMEEIAMLRPWYNITVTSSKRTTVGVSGMEPEAMGSFVAEFLDGNVPSSRENRSSAGLLKLAVHDLKAFYFEAAMPQPGQDEMDGDTLSIWFWRETVAGKVVFAVRKAHADSEDVTLRLIITRQLVPRAHSGYLPIEASQ